MKLSTHPESTVARKIYKMLTCRNMCMLLRIKKRVSNFRRRKMPLFIVLSFHTQKLAENLKIITINSWKSTQCMFYIRFMYVRQTTEGDYNTPFRCFQTKTRHATGRMKAFSKGHVSCRMLSIKKRLLSRLFCTKYYISYRDVRFYNNIKWAGKYSSDFMQNFAEKKRRVLLCSANTWIGTHATFPVILKQCCHFSVVHSFQFEFATHLMYYRANIRDQLIKNTTIMSVDVILSV